MKFLKKGFTLAEVLITLGIIGIVAALTIPTLMSKYREKETITKLKKANTLLSQIYLAAQADNGLYSFSDTPQQSEVEEFFNTYWKPYIKILKECNTYKACGYDTAKPFKYLNGTNSDYYLVYTGRKAFITQDNVVYMVIVFSVINSSRKEYAYEHRIWVDVNGGKGPNLFGKDVFIFKYVTNKTVFPAGYELSDSKLLCTKNNTGQGSYCAERIRRNDWKIPDDYPVKF